MLVNKQQHEDNPDGAIEDLAGIPIQVRSQFVPVGLEKMRFVFRITATDLKYCNSSILFGLIQILESNFVRH